MSGIELRDGTLIVGREPNQLDELAMEFSDFLNRFSIDHVYIAGYVSILAGRARSTEDVDVLIEDIDEATAEELAETLKEEGFWGAAMPLSSMYEMLSNGDNIWAAPEDSTSVPRKTSKTQSTSTRFLSKALVLSVSKSG